MSWERDQRRLAAMTPEERAAWTERQSQKRRERYLRSLTLTDEERAQASSRREAERLAREKREAALKKKRDDERARQARKKREDEQSLTEFLAQGAQEYGFSYFLKSEAHRRAIRMNQGKELAS